MNYIQFPHKIEIAVWNILIPLMKDSPRLAYFIYSGFGWMEKTRSGAFWMPFFLWASTGLSLGLVLGFVAGMLK